jgi:hypothetical protein
LRVCFCLSWIPAAKWKHKHLQGVFKLFCKLFFFFLSVARARDHVKVVCRRQGRNPCSVIQMITNNPLHPSRL